MNDTAIHVENLGKLYKIGGIPTSYKTIRDSITEAFKGPLNLFKSPKAELFWALKDISLKVKYGEVIGIIGRNGAGKTTLLKVLSRITKPTTGWAEVYGRVGSLLEVGTGFHQELTGRENIYLNGAILGMRRSEIKRKFDEIVDFAEIGKFLDTPVKRYSSGMYVRLAFAVAAHLEPEILLVDEVLAVGDSAFQKKCLGKMGDLSRSGRTILFVSHNLGVINQLCERVVWLDQGQLVKVGFADEIIHEYLNFNSNYMSGTWHNTPSCKQKSNIHLHSASILTANGPSGIVRFDEEFCLEVNYEVLASMPSWSLVFRLRDASGTAIFTSWDTDYIEPEKLTRPGTYRAVCQVPGKLLRPGTYSVTLGSYAPRSSLFDIQEDLFHFQISSVGYTMNSNRLGVITPVFNWSVKALS